MKKNGLKAVVAATALSFVFATATPATAGDTFRTCGHGAGVRGFTESTMVGTNLNGINSGPCGKLGVRANYVHMGGDSWLSWKYSTGWHDYVYQSVNNSVRAMHSTTIQNLLFYSYRNL